MVVKLRWSDVTKGHYTVTIFVGPDADHLANTGHLTMRPDEAERFRGTIREGSGTDGGTGFEGVLESGWPELGQGPLS